MGNTLDSIELGRNLLGIDNLIPLNPELLGSLDRCLRIIPDSYAEHIEFISMIFLIDLLEIRHFRLAGAAPRSPEIYEDILSLADIVGEFHC